MKRKAGKKVIKRAKPSLMKVAVHRDLTNGTFEHVTHLPTKLVSLFHTFPIDEVEWKRYPYGGRYQETSQGTDKWFKYVDQIRRQGIREPIELKPHHSFTTMSRFLSGFPSSQTTRQKRIYENPLGITNGNHRRFAALELGMKKVPVLIPSNSKRGTTARDLYSVFKFSIRRAKGI